jgi:cell division protein FtsI (penicillin-binding protein 3)
VVIHEPDKSVGYYGADVSGPVFKKIAQKIFTDTPLIDVIETLEFKNSIVEEDFEDYYEVAKTYITIMPSVVGMPTMDAIPLLENMGLKVKVDGTGKVKGQSIDKGEKVSKNQTVVLNI